MILSGLDLASAKDFTALACLDRHPLPEGKAGPKRRWRYECRWLQTWDLGVKYTTIAADLKKLYDTPQLKGTVLVPDYTGVGRPVVDQFRALRVQAKINPVLITAGKIAHEDSDGNWLVPKRELVATLQVLLQSELLVIDRRLKLADRLKKELQDFRVTITKSGNETFGAVASQHDDIVMAVMLAAWYGERSGGGAGGIGLPEHGKGCEVESAPVGTMPSNETLVGSRWVDDRKFGG